jgi:hypothetical protein
LEVWPFCSKRLKIEPILLPSNQTNILINKIKGSTLNTIVNVIGIIYVTIVLASIYVPTLLAALKIIPPHPLFMVNTFYGLIYVPSLVIPISYAIIWPKSIKIGIQAFPCCN